MDGGNRLPTGGDKVKKALKWLGEELRNNPQKNRAAVLRAAEIRFDLSPAECEFLSNNFGSQAPC